MQTSEKAYAIAELAKTIKTDIALSDVIRVCIDIKKMGNHGFTGKCPFHNDKKPSLSISDKKGVWKCFSNDCHGGGDAIKFWQKYYNIDNALTAMLQIADRFGVGIPNALKSKERKKKDKKKICEFVRSLATKTAIKHIVSYAKPQNEIDKYLNRYVLSVDIPGDEIIRAVRDEYKSLRLPGLTQIKSIRPGYIYLCSDCNNLTGVFWQSTNADKSRFIAINRDKRLLSRAGNTQIVKKCHSHALVIPDSNDFKNSPNLGLSVYMPFNFNSYVAQAWNSEQVTFFISNPITAYHNAFNAYKYGIQPFFFHCNGDRVDAITHLADFYSRSELIDIALELKGDKQANLLTQIHQIFEAK